MRPADAGNALAGLLLSEHARANERAPVTARVYDVGRDLVRDAEGREHRGVQRVLDGELAVQTPAADEQHPARELVVAGGAAPVRHSRVAAEPWLCASAQILRDLTARGVQDVEEPWSHLLVAWNRAMTAQDELLQMDAQTVLRQLRSVFEAMLRAQVRRECWAVLGSLLHTAAVGTQHKHKCIGEGSEGAVGTSRLDL